MCVKSAKPSVDSVCIPTTMQAPPNRGKVHEYDLKFWKAYKYNEKVGLRSSVVQLRQLIEAFMGHCRRSLLIDCFGGSGLHGLCALMEGCSLFTIEKNHPGVAKKNIALCCENVSQGTHVLCPEWEVKQKAQETLKKQADETVALPAVELASEEVEPEEVQEATNNWQRCDKLIGGDYRATTELLGQGPSQDSESDDDDGWADSDSD